MEGTQVKSIYFLLRNIYFAIAKLNRYAINHPEYNSRISPD